MENLVIRHTEETPEVNFNVNGQLSIKGVSIPENITHFYTPLINWITELEKHQPSKLNLTFEIEYVNTSSTRVLIDMIKKVNAIREKYPDTTITWRYVEDDEDIYDLGKDLEYSTKASFIFETV
jgi:hypothetical protein